MGAMCGRNAYFRKHSFTSYGHQKCWSWERHVQIFSKGSHFGQSVIVMKMKITLKMQSCAMYTFYLKSTPLESFEDCTIFENTVVSYDPVMWEVCLSGWNLFLLGNY